MMNGQMDQFIVIMPTIPYALTFKHSFKNYIHKFLLFLVMAIL